jgi:hypothetical protein
MLSENDQKVIKFLKAQRLFIPDRIRYAELTDIITKFESGEYSYSMYEEQLPHKVWLNVQMALGGYFERKGRRIIVTDLTIPQRIEY